jgi:hypothetical protein
MAERTGRPELTMFVKSYKEIDQTFRPIAEAEPLIGSGSITVPVWDDRLMASNPTGGEQAVEGSERNVVPDEDRMRVMTTWKIADGLGYQLHVVDIGQHSRFHAIIEKHLHDLKEFPVLVRPNGDRLEGPAAFSEDGLRAFLALPPVK